MAAELGARLGAGESACLAIAKVRGYSIATDDTQAMRIATELLGPGRVLTTPGLLLVAIRADVITVEDADSYKAILERRRFNMGFHSFREFV